MSSTFAGLALFNSGPHRFIPRALGRIWLPPLRIDELQETTLVIAAPAEVAIVQTGRLVAPDDASLWALLDAIRAEAEAATTGALVEQSGRTWNDMTLLRFVPADRFDRARTVSLAYRADYIRLAVPAP